MNVTIADTTLFIADDRIDGKDNLIEQKLERYLAGERVIFDEPLDFSGLTTFQKRVLEEIRDTPYGETVTYGELAERINKPNVERPSRTHPPIRAVGNACGANPVPVVVPCHRVVAKNGLGGYTGGTTAKRALLNLET